MRKNLLNKVNSISTKTRNFAIGTGVAVSTLVSSLPVLATEPTLDPSITAGFTQASATVAVIIAAGVAATVGVVAASGGAKAGLKWIKGVFAKAS